MYSMSVQANRNSLPSPADKDLERLKISGEVKVRDTFELSGDLRKTFPEFKENTDMRVIKTFGERTPVILRERSHTTVDMLLLEELPGFLTVLINLHMRFDSTYVQKEPVNFTSLNPLGDCPGSLNGAMRAPTKCLVVIQEWWGMNEQIKQQALDIAGQGKFATMVPDLYRGKVAKNSTEAIHLISNLNYTGAVQDIKGAAQYLLKQGCKKVGVTGFCMGGSLSLAAAALVPEISAAAPFYGIPPSALANVSTIKIPVQCHFGKRDVSNTANPTKYGELKQQLDAGGVEYEFYEYDAGHAFTNPHSANYNKSIAELSVGRMIDFMNKHLGS